MSIFLYDLVPTAMLGLFTLLVIKRMWRSSVSTFIAMFGLTLISNLMHYGYINSGLVMTIVVSLILILRAIFFKQRDDKFFHKMWNGKERRNANYKQF